MGKEITLKLQISQDILDILTFLAKQSKFTKEEIAKMFISRQIEDMVNWLEGDTTTAKKEIVNEEE